MFSMFSFIQVLHEISVGFVTDLTLRNGRHFDVIDSDDLSLRR